MDSKLRWLAAGLGGLSVFAGSIFTIRATSSGSDRRKLPTYLSEAGLFRDLSTLTPSPGLIPYEINVPSWSDGAKKRRWLMVPGDGSSRDPTKDRVIIKPGLPWAFPTGSVFVTQFDWTPDQSRPSRVRRLETRVLIRDQDAGVYGFTYRWDADGTDAVLVQQTQSETLTVRHTDGSISQQLYDFPAPDECLVCHNQSAGGVLGVNYQQIDRLIVYANGSTPTNQFIAWNRAALLSKAVEEPQALDAWNLLKVPQVIPLPFWSVANAGRLTPTDDETSAFEDRARSYLEANCSSCHSPGIVSADWDARSSTPLKLARLIGAPARIPMFEARNIIEPGSPERSLLYLRVSSVHPAMKMPPLGRNTVDEAGVRLLSMWIKSLPRR